MQGCMGRAKMTDIELLDILKIAETKEGNDGV